MKKIPPPPPAGASKRPRGRPRGFDREQALDRAMDVFWSKGFEGASLSDLTKAMDINPPSLYAAFGDKEGLFIEAVRRYYANVQDQCSACPESTSARESMQAFLSELAKVFTDTNHPRGCLAVMAMTTALSSSPRMQEFLSEKRAASKARMRANLQKAVDSGELPEDTDVGALTNFYSAVISGMSLHARDGASRKALLAMVETAMRAWPATSAAARQTRARATVG
jgi:AcrR family transcriptional regulator